MVTTHFVSIVSQVLLAKCDARQQWPRVLSSVAVMASGAMGEVMKISEVELEKAETMVKRLLEEAELEEISKEKVQTLLEKLGAEFCKFHGFPCTLEEIEGDLEELRRMCVDVQEAMYNIAWITLDSSQMEVSLQRKQVGV